MSKKTVSIIGGGLASLSLGCYLQRSGFLCSIYEKRDRVGGTIYALNQDGYVFETSLPYLIGIDSSSAYYKIWEELGVLPSLTSEPFEIYKEMEYETGKVFKFYANLDALSIEMEKISPADKPQFSKLFLSAKELSVHPMPLDKPGELLNFLDYIKIFKKHKTFLRLYNQWNGVSVSKFCEEISSQNLKTILFGMAGGEALPIFDLIHTLALLQGKALGYPNGGSEKIVESLKRTFIEKNGEIYYGKTVKKIKVEDGKAKELLLDDETSVLSDIVVSAMDGYATLFSLLGTQYLDEAQKNLYAQAKRLGADLQIGIGGELESELDLRNLPHRYRFLPKEPIEIDPHHLYSQMEIFLYPQEESGKGSKKVTMVLDLDTDYDHWNRLKKEDPKGYRVRKEEILARVLEELKASVFGLGICPKTTYLRTPDEEKSSLLHAQGAYRGWVRDSQNANRILKKKCSSIRNFYLVGRWVEMSGGHEQMALSGRNVAQLICKEEKVRFVAKSPEQSE
jgi:phytoene dehydrogenase-like protein